MMSLIFKEMDSRTENSFGPNVGICSVKNRIFLSTGLMELERFPWVCFPIFIGLKSMLMLFSIMDIKMRNSRGLPLSGPQAISFWSGHIQFKSDYCENCFIFNLNQATRRSAITIIGLHALSMLFTKTDMIRLWVERWVELSNILGDFEYNFGHKTILLEVAICNSKQA